MEWIIIIAAIIVFSTIILIKVLQKSKAEPTDYPYQKKTLFTPAERSFLGVLNQAVGESAKVFGKIRIADVITPNKGLSRSNWQKAFNKISGKHFDFLLCNNNDLSIVCAIELNDKSHLSGKRKQRDEFLNKVCDAAGLPLIKITAKRNYVLNDIKELISPHLHLN